MALVDHYHLACKAEMAQHHVLLPERCHQQLVHRTNDKTGQQCLFAAPEPLVYLHPVFFCFRVVPVIFHPHGLALQLDVFLIQLCHAMRQPDGFWQIVRLVVRPLHQPLEKAVCRCLRGQAKEDSACPEPCRKDLGGS